MALTLQGFKRETYETITVRMERRAKELFGEKVNTTSRGVLGKLIRLVAFILSFVWQDIEDVYHSGFLDTATGTHLDKLVTSLGVRRNVPTAANGEVEFKGEAGAVVPLGTGVTKADDTTYFTTEEITLDAAGVGYVLVIAEERGAHTNAAVGEISSLLNTADGVTSVTNLVPLTNGADIESDDDLRRRAIESAEGLGSSTLAAIYAALIRVDGVQGVIIDENVSAETNELGTPPHSIQPFVLGGFPQDIAETILDKKAAGIKSHGSNIVEVIDLSGTKQLIGFSRPVTQMIRVRADVTTNDLYPVNGDELVKNAVVRYIGGIDSFGDSHRGLQMGDDVILAKVIAAAMMVDGVTDVSVTIGKNGEAQAAANIEIGSQTIAQTDMSYIEVI